MHMFSGSTDSQYVTSSAGSNVDHCTVSREATGCRRTSVKSHWLSGPPAIQTFPVIRGFTPFNK